MGYKKYRLRCRDQFEELQTEPSNAAWRSIFFEANSKECDVNSQRIRNWPTKERPRERLLAEGPERLTDVDLLAIILRVGSGTFKADIPGKNAYESALSILKDFRGRKETS